MVWFPARLCDEPDRSSSYFINEYCIERGRHQRIRHTITWKDLLEPGEGGGVGSRALKECVPMQQHLVES